MLELSLLHIVTYSKTGELVSTIGSFNVLLVVDDSQYLEGCCWDANMRRAICVGCLAVGSPVTVSIYSSDQGRDLRSQSIGL
jgi:hypothetical protein